MRFRFVEEQREAFPIDRLCQVMNVSPRGLRAFRSRPASCRQRMDMIVLAHIKEQSSLSLGSYGRPRMTEEMKEVGVDVGHRRVGRLMHENGIIVERTRKFKATTDSNHTFNIAPNQKWAGDISYIWTREGWLYLAVILDLHSRRVMILCQRGFKVSMSGKGNCYDNAAVETFFKTIKAELIWRRSWETRRQAQTAIFEYINGFYNPWRRHSALGWKSPVAFERKVA